jgi:hypothetical protein
MRFSTSFSNPRKAPPPTTKMKKGRKRLTYIRSMGLKKTTEKAMR